MCPDWWIACFVFGYGNYLNFAFPALCVCVCSSHHCRLMDINWSMIVIPACAISTGKTNFPCFPVRTWEIGLASWVRLFRGSSLILHILNLVATYGLYPSFPAVSIWIVIYHLVRPGFSVNTRCKHIEIVNSQAGSRRTCEIKSNTRPAPWAVNTPAWYVHKSKQFESTMSNVLEDYNAMRWNNHSGDYCGKAVDQFTRQFWSISLGNREKSYQHTM